MVTAAPTSRVASSTVGASRWAVIALGADAILASPLSRLVRLGSVSLTLGYGIAMVVLHVNGGDEVVDAVALRGISVLSWFVAGPIALVAAREPADRVALQSLAAQRGARLGGLLGADAASAVTRALGWPALALALLGLALSPTLGAAPIRLAQVAGLVVYVGLLGASLGILARWSARVAPVRGRELFLGLLLGPYFADALVPGFPSVPGAFGELLGWLLDLGAP